jgi:hypothetical protein
MNLAGESAFAPPAGSGSNCIVLPFIGRIYPVRLGGLSKRDKQGSGADFRKSGRAVA